jgi:uncharacterized protein (TIGR02466 family)
MSNIKNISYSHMNWGPFVLKTKLPDYIIKELLIQGKKTKQSYNRSLAGHLNNQYLYPNEVQNWFYGEIQPILQAYRQGHCKFHGIQDLTVELGFDDLWINYMKAGDFNPMHTHGGDYSFVIFLQVPDKLKKEMKDFEGTSAKPGMLMFEYTQQAKPRWATTGTAIAPETGDFYMFPALLQHWVAPFKSKIERISVSGNMRILNKDKLPNDYF